MTRFVKLYKAMSLPVKASVWFVFLSFFTSFVGLITVPIYTRVLVSEDYGQFNLYTSWLAIFTVIGGLHLSGGMFNRMMSHDEENRDRLYASMIGLNIFAVAFFALIVFLLLQLNIIAFPFQNILFFLMMSQIIFTSAKAIWIARIRYDYKYVKTVLSSILVAISIPAIGIILIVFTDLNYIALIISQFVVGSAVFMLIILNIFSRRLRVINKTYWLYA